jgi:hypothetical protein
MLRSPAIVVLLFIDFGLKPTSLDTTVVGTTYPVPATPLLQT